ncbi:hypothetical protein [Halocatena halophila]|uniref:hypothetical protein n=1 Tax=Halocatena halophila TaxID=2814576 RepID=UPI002ED527B8
MTDTSDSEGHQRIAVDFDKTLSAADGGTYFTDRPTLPNKDMIEWVNRQYRSGHTIIIWTARPWSEAGQTAAKLTEWGVRWHGMICEKGSADIYVDDKATTPDQVVEDSEEVA